MKKAIVIVIAIVVLGGAAWWGLQNRSTSNSPVGEISIVDKEPRFADYPVKEIYKETSAVIDFSSDPTGDYIRDDRRTEALKNIAATGSNFAGHYYIISSGCGTSCASFWVADLTTGKLYPILGTSGPKPAFRADSRLLIYGPETRRGGIEARYYVFDNNQLKLIYSKMGASAIDAKLASWKTYRNEQYGFEVKFPDSWARYRVTAEDIALPVQGIVFNFELRPRVDRAYYPLLQVSIFTITEWTKWPQEFSRPEQFKQNGDWVYVVHHPPSIERFESKDYWEAPYNSIPQILSTFKFIK